MILGVTFEHVQMNVREKRSWNHVQFQHVQQKSPDFLNLNCKAFQKRKTTPHSKTQA